jgi:hypothetical protein
MRIDIVAVHCTATVAFVRRNFDRALSMNNRRRCLRALRQHTPRMPQRMQHANHRHVLARTALPSHPHEFLLESHAIRTLARCTRAPTALRKSCAYHTRKHKRDYGNPSARVANRRPSITLIHEFSAILPRCRSQSPVSRRTAINSQKYK